MRRINRIHPDHDPDSQNQSSFRTSEFRHRPLMSTTQRNQVHLSSFRANRIQPLSYQINQIQPIDYPNHRHENHHKGAPMSEEELKGWIEDKFVAPLLKKTKNNSKHKNEKIYHDQGYLFGKNPWFYHQYSNFYAAAALSTLFLRTACIGLFCLKVDPKNPRSAISVYSGMTYCAFSVLRTALRSADNIFKTKKSISDISEKEAIVQARDFCDGLFHLVNITGLFILKAKQGERSIAVPLVSLIITIIMVFCSLTFILRNPNEHLIRRGFMALDIYINITEWAGWAVVFGMVKMRFYLTQIVLLAASGFLLFSGTTILYTIIVPCIFAKKKKNLEIAFLTQSGLLFGTLISLLVVFGDLASHLPEGKSSNSIKIFGVLGAVVALVIMLLCVGYAILVVRFKFTEVESPQTYWITDLIQIYEERKKKRLEEAYAKHNMEVYLKETESIYRVGENLYSEQKPKKINFEDAKKNGSSVMSDLLRGRICVCFQALRTWWGLR